MLTVRTRIPVDADGVYLDCACAPERTCLDCDPCSIAVARSDAFPTSPPCRIDLVLAKRAPQQLRAPAYRDPQPSPAWRTRSGTAQAGWGNGIVRIASRRGNA